MWLKNGREFTGSYGAELLRGIFQGTVAKRLRATWMDSVDYN